MYNEFVKNMMGGHGVSLKPCSQVNYAFRKREGAIGNLEHCAQFEKYSMTTSGWKAENIQVIPIRN